MKSIKIHGSDEKISEKISDLAAERGLSLNKTIKLLLSKALGFKNQTYQNRIEDFKHFSGVWSKEESEIFNKNVEDFSEIDMDDWK